MPCLIRWIEKPDLSNPTLIEGLPGIGFVANIAALHLIQELQAKPFADIHSPSFHDLAITGKDGKVTSPQNTLYYYKSDDIDDLIILYGNTQALSSFGQYELCDSILDVVQELGCKRIITLGGMKGKEKIENPRLFCAATDAETLKDALQVGARVVTGQIFGVAGVLIGLGKLREMKGLCLLGETPGFYPDAVAARLVLDALNKLLGLNVDLRELDIAVEATRDILKGFGIGEPLEKKVEGEAPTFKWFI